MPDMIFVESSYIEAIGYDLPARELYVRLSDSGKTYVYSEVEEPVFEEFKSADSKGTFLNTRIKNRYDFRKM